MTRISLCNTYAKNLNTYVNKKTQTSFKSKKDAFKPTIIEGTQTYAKVYAATLDDATKAQIRNICSHPVFKDLPVRIMPDTHVGKNTVVGFTAPIGAKGEIIPSLIGGDIGCGMLCCEVDTNGSDIDFQMLDNVIKNQIPSKQKRIIAASNETKVIDELISKVEDKNLSDNLRKMLKKLGTLGGGNHFIEIDQSTSGKTYLVIHTGSRGFGQTVFDYHQNVAVRQNPFENINLSFLNGDMAKRYLEDTKIAQRFAQANRRIIADEIIKQMGWKEVNTFESVHNYIADDEVIRKGAISAYSGQKLIIPLNMRDGALIAEGKGNPDWNSSAPHGAGRILTRKSAKQKISLQDYKDSMNGIYTSCINEKTIDESPQAYKDSQMIADSISPTSKIIDWIRPLYNYKNQK